MTGVTAVDHDIGDNGLVVYDLQQADARYFNIDPVSGIIEVAQSITPGQTYQLTVTATDKVCRLRS